MLRNKLKRILFPKEFLFRLTFINILVIIALVTLSGWAVYNTACMLIDELPGMGPLEQQQFRAMLFQYLALFSLLAIILGSLIHFYLVKKITNPLKELILFTKKVKRGFYPSPLPKDSSGEVGELTEHFNELVQKLASNEEERKKLISDLSHEFRTPLTNLNGYLRALQNEDIEGNKQLYQSLYDESTKLTQLVEQIEQLKEWDELGMQPFDKKEPIEMKTFIEESINIFRRALEQNKIALELELDSKVINISRTPISQVISNLMDNAIRYYEGSDPITIKGELMGNNYKVSITGQGKMISYKDKERLFERLYRAEPSRSRELGGSGLGLAISKEIIERHQGEIGVYSEENIHTFWFSLPSE